MKTVNKVVLRMNYMEFGYLYACIDKEAWDKMPRRLYLKLKITFTKAYLKHPRFKKQALRDIKIYKEQLLEENK